MDGFSVSVEFKAQNEDEAVSWRLNPTILKKLNKFSVNQVIRIRNDERTIRSIECKFNESEIRQKVVICSLKFFGYEALKMSCLIYSWWEPPVE